MGSFGLRLGRKEMELKLAHGGAGINAGHWLRTGERSQQVA